jgi:hypothetical protein
MGPERFARFAAAPMRRRAAVVRETIVRGLSIAALLAAAAALAGCGTAPRPFSIEEKIWFYKASHPDRIIGYPELHPDHLYDYRGRHHRVIDDAPPFVPPPAGYRG